MAAWVQLMKRWRAL